MTTDRELIQKALFTYIIRAKEHIDIIKDSVDKNYLKEQLDDLDEMENLYKKW